MSTITVWVTTAVCVLTIVLVYGMVIGSRATKTSMESHYVGDRSIHPIITMLTMMATLMSAFVLVGLSGFFYTHGIGSWVYVGFSNVSMWLLTIVFGYRLWLLGRRFGYVTPIEFLSDRYESKAVGVIAAAISIVFLFPYMAVQLTGVGKLIEGLTGGQFPYFLAVVVAGILGLCVCFFGGMRTVAWTDAIQGGFMFILGVVIAVWFLAAAFHGSVGELFAKVAESKPALLSLPGPTKFFSHGMLFSLTLAAFFMPLSQMQLASRFLIPRDKKAFRLLLIGSALIPIIAILPPMFIGLGASVLWPNLKSGDFAFSTMLVQYFPVPMIVAALLAVFAACLTTIDSQLLAIGSLIGKDLLPGLSDKVAVTISKVAMVLILAFVVVFSFSPPKLIVNLAIASYTGTLQMIPTVVAAFFWKGATRAGAMSSMVAGVIVYSVLKWTKLHITWGHFDPSFWGLIVASVVLVVVSQFTAKPKESVDRIQNYLDSVYPG